MPEMAESLWSWMTEYPDGSVGPVIVYIIRENPGNVGAWVTLIGRDRVAAERLGEFAEIHRQKTGQRIWLREYRNFTDHDIRPSRLV